MSLNSHISAYARCLARKVCGLVQSTWGTFQGEDKLGARDKILNTKVVCWACAGRAPRKHSPKDVDGETFQKFTDTVGGEFVSKTELVKALGTYCGCMGMEHGPRR